MAWSMDGRPGILRRRAGLLLSNDLVDVDVDDHLDDDEDYCGTL